MAITRRKILLAAPAIALSSQTFGRGGIVTVTPSPPATGLQFNLILDPSWGSAPSSYVTALSQAVSLLQAAYTNVSATINLHVGYQTIWLSAGLPDSPISASQSAGVYIGHSTISYATIRSALAGLSFQSTSLTQMLTNTPAGSTLNGNSTFVVTSAIQKFLSLFGFSGGPTSPTDPIIDGSIGIGSGWGSDKLVGVCLHEMSHTMGRVVQTAPFVFTRFTSVGQRDFGTSTSAYFSLDNGNTNIDSYDPTGSDTGDFSNTGSFPLDCFNAQQANGANQFLSTLDNQLMNSMGIQ